MSDTKIDVMKCKCLYWARIFDTNDEGELNRHHPNCDKRIKVYAMNDCDWVASTSAEKARKWYLTEYMSESLDSGDEFCDLEPKELTKDEMNRLTYNDLDGFLKEEPAKYTFREALDLQIEQEDKDSFFFATTEY